ncbi:hypothetical protein CBR_g19874 [Chara braunii]|uniref:Uncharacterized protein n=1 Tax=Chara braunii TaxID=69332 RepID=A0A388KYY8_CHABU|nr:hypothetical protein CBR_g19874 [Chara braunii]|eukprot:GBG75238.1 hypothetical protein CBR_g19874 [Chara braunii]
MKQQQEAGDEEGEECVLTRTEHAEHEKQDKGGGKGAKHQSRRRENDEQQHEEQREEVEEEEEEEEKRKPCVGVWKAQLEYGGNGGNSNNYGRGHNPNRAFFTREHTKLLNKIKFQEAVAEATKKQVEVKEVEVTQPKKIETKKEEVKKQPATTREDEMKRWMTATFGSSLRALTEKVDKVDDKSKMAEKEREELRLLRAEKELRELKEGSSSEKRKSLRDGIAPSTSPRAGRVKTKSTVKARSRPQNGVLIMSDDDEAGISRCRGNLGKKFDEAGASRSASTSTEMGEIKDLLKSLVEALPKLVGAQDRWKAVVTEEINEDDNEKMEAEQSGVEEEEAVEEKDELDLVAYMRNRVESYETMHYLHIRTLCAEKGISYIRKDLGVMELARLGLEDYMKSLREMEENGVTVSEPVEEDDREDEVENVQKN